MRQLLRAGAAVDARDWQGNGPLEWTRHAVAGHAADVVLTLPRTAAHAECEAMLRSAALPNPAAWSHRGAGRLAAFVWRASGASAGRAHARRAV